MEVVEGDKESHQEQEDQEKDGEPSRYWVHMTEILKYHTIIRVTQNPITMLPPPSCILALGKTS